MYQQKTVIIYISQSPHAVRQRLNPDTGTVATMASKVYASILLASPLFSPCLGFLAPLPSARSLSKHARSERNHARCPGTLREAEASARTLRRRNDAQPRRTLWRTSGQALGATFVEAGTADDPTLAEPLKQWAEENFPGCSTRQSSVSRSIQACTKLSLGDACTRLHVRCCCCLPLQLRA